MCICIHICIHIYIHISGCIYIYIYTENTFYTRNAAVHDSDLFVDHLCMGRHICHELTSTSQTHFHVTNLFLCLNSLVRYVLISISRTRFYVTNSCPCHVLLSMSRNAAVHDSGFLIHHMCRSRTHFYVHCCVGRELIYRTC